MIVLNNGATLQNGRLTIVNILGQGSFGITYLAMQNNMGVQVYVTVKEFFMSAMNTRGKDGSTVENTDSSLVKDYKRKFIREAENLMQLQHTNIVKVLEVFEENNTAYYVMEYLDGGSLDEFIIRNRRLTVEQTMGITTQVCAALQYMHNNRMLHLDLKPKNIMLTSSGMVKLIDFGLSKQYKENGEPEDSTTIGLGTPGYAPIEQATYRQDGSLPVTLDVYALGATMYKMLTGMTPPDSSTVLNNGLSLRPLRQAGIDQRLILIVSKALSPTRNARFQSVQEMEMKLKALNGKRNDDTLKTGTNHGIKRIISSLGSLFSKTKQSIANNEMIQRQKDNVKDRITALKYCPVPFWKRLLNAILLIVLVISGWWIFFIIFQKGRDFLKSRWDIVQGR